MHHYGCASFWVEEVPVKEEFNGQVVWQGTVQVFELLGCPKAKRVYAWSYATEDNNRRVHTVLELGPVKDAVTAVRAEIAAEAMGGAP